MSEPEPILDAPEETTGLPAFPTWRGVYVFVVVFFLAILAFLIILERVFA